LVKPGGDWLAGCAAVAQIHMLIPRPSLTVNGRFTKADREHFFTIARGSVQECVPLLELARRRGLIQVGRHDRLKDHLEKTARMLSGLIKGLDKRCA
jgi:hypothetical protein